MKKAKINRLLSSLSSLLCFTNITRINTITGGLSNPCFKVEADGNDYFAKKTNVQLFETEKQTPEFITELSKWIEADPELRNTCRMS